MADQLRADIEAAKNKTETRIGAGRELRKLETYLWDTETVQLLAAGTYGPGTGLVALTDRRLLFIKDGVMSKTIEDFPVDKISSVQWSSGLLMGSLIVFASGNKAEIKNMSKKDGQQIADAIRGRLSPRPGPPAPAIANQSSDDVYDSLRKLGELRDAGILSPEEFEAKKRELLSRL